MMQPTSMSFFMIILISAMPMISSNNFATLGIDLYETIFDMNDHMIVLVSDRTEPVFSILTVQNPIRSCRINMSYFFSDDMYIMDLAVPNIGDSSWNVFFYSARVYDPPFWRKSQIFRVEVFIQRCIHSSSRVESVLSYYFSLNRLMGVAKSGDGLINILLGYTAVINYGSASLVEQHGLPFSLAQYRADVFDTLYIDNWVLMAGEELINGLYIPTLYLIDYLPFQNRSSYVDSWTPSLPYSWQRSVSPTFLNGYESSILNASAVAVNKRGDILFGVQSLNTVYYLRVDPINPSTLSFVSSRINDAITPRVGFGKSVAWLDDDTAVILANIYSIDYNQFYESRIEIYDLSGTKKLTDSTAPYVYFPNSKQTPPKAINSHFIQMTASYYGAIALMDSTGSVFVIQPPGEGYYAITMVPWLISNNIYYSSKAFCPSGTTRYVSRGPKEILAPCMSCDEGDYYDKLPSGTFGCKNCLADMFCPIGSTIPISESYLENRSQATSYPKSTEASAFDDILFSNMFSLNFRRNCFYVAPMFWTLCMLGCALILIFIIVILRFSGKCPTLLGAIQTIFTHFDIINDGERWIGGVFSFALLIMIAYAGLFTNSFLSQYPLSESKAPQFTCDDSLRNSDFFTSMKALNNHMFQESGTIFNLLSQQTYTIIITFLSLQPNAMINVTQAAGSVQKLLSCVSTIPDPRVFIQTCPLQSNLGSVIFNLTNVVYLGGIRIAMKAPKLVKDSREAQEVDFIYSYRIPYHLIASEPYYNIELTPLINETKPLSSGDESKFSGIWLPIINKDDTRNFVTRQEHDENQQTTVLLTIEFTQANYYISNQERPLVRTNRAIFKNILFASTCMELFGFGFLLMKLAILPLGQCLLKMFQKNKQDQSDEKGEEEEEEEEEDDDDDDQSGNEPQSNAVAAAPSGPTVNDWYVPEKQS